MLETNRIHSESGFKILIMQRLYYIRIDFAVEEFAKEQ